MFDISNIDENFKVNNNLPEDIYFYDCFTEPIEINGLYLDNDENVFTRLPERFMERNDINDALKYLMYDTAGGRIRFATDSPYVAVVVELLHVINMMHMPATGHSGMDIYTCKIGCNDYTYKKTFMPKSTINAEDKVYSGLCELELYDEHKKHEVMLNLPLYNGLVSVKIGIKKGCKLFSPVSYKIDKPVYFYGSSITQGGCASRPGNTYMGYISRWLNIDYVNLGFSGSAKGETEIAEYIASKEMSAFVLDYDANAPSEEHLEKTHYPFYKKIRDSHPDIPIIIISFPRFDKRPFITSLTSNKCTKDQCVCNNIILKTYMKAIEEGDKNVYYIDGSTVFGTEDQDGCTVDNCHPNDLGFYKMAKTIYPVFKKTFK